MTHKAVLNQCGTVYKLDLSDKENQFGEIHVDIATGELNRILAEFYKTLPSYQQEAIMDPYQKITNAVTKRSGKFSVIIEPVLNKSILYKPIKPIQRNMDDDAQEDPRQIALNRFEQIEGLPYGERGSAMKQLADEFGIAIKTLYGWRTQYKMTGTIEDRRKIIGTKKQIKTMHLDRWKKIADLLEASFSISYIKNLLGVSESQIYRVKSRYKHWLSENYQ